MAKLAMVQYDHENRKNTDIESLYSDGPHLGSYSYEIGNPTLTLEKTYGFESSIQYQKKEYFFSLTDITTKVQATINILRKATDTNLVLIG